MKEFLKPEGAILPVSQKHSISVSLCFLMVLVVGWFVLSPGLSGPFMLDDFDNLSALEGGVTDFRSLEEYMSKGNAGPLDRPISKLTFLINDNAWPSDPYSFKRTNLLIHLLIGVVLFCAFRILIRLYRRDLPADWIALVAVAIWILHPFQISTVLYAVQRMTLMATLFMAIGLALHLFLRFKTLGSMTFRDLVLMSLNLGIFSMLAVFSKENGALLPVFIATVELTLLARHPVSVHYKWWRRVFLWTPSLLIIAYIIYLPNWLGGYAHREFSLYERLLTESVIIWDYLHSIFTLEVYKLGLFHDDYPIYSSVFSWNVMLSAVGIVLSVLISLLLRKHWPIISFCVLWFLVGHLIESTTIPLELYFEHRNYLSIAGISFSISLLAYIYFSKLSSEFSRFYYVFMPVTISIIAAISWGFASEWGDENKIIPIWAAEHPDSPRAQRTFAQYLANQGLPDMALDSLDYSHEKFPYDLSIPLMSAGISCAFERKFRFDFDEIQSQIDEYRWTDALRPAASHLQQILPETHCAPLAPKFAELLTKTQEFDRAKTKGISSLLVIAGNMYLSAGDGDSALRLFVKVDEIKPSVDSATRIAGLFLGAGQYEQARINLEIAIERDSASGISSDKMKEYVRFFELIDRKIEEQQ